MSIVAWIQDRNPGAVSRHDDRIEIAHYTSDRSTLWFKPPSLHVPEELLRLDDLFSAFDGGDLFSSAFKIASVADCKFRGSVALTPTLRSLADDLHGLSADFGEPATAFMHEAGGWIYAVAHSSGRILSWDSEFSEAGVTYETIYDVFDAWFESLRDDDTKAS